MSSIEDVSAAIYDTTVIVKGLVSPRRKKKDALYEEQVKLHALASALLKNAENGRTRVGIPSIALVETAAVISRLTNDTKTAEEAVSFLRSNCRWIKYEAEIVEEAIKVGIQTKTSGFDVLFLTCSKLLNIPLVTDDERLFRTGKKYGFNLLFLRDWIVGN